MGSQCVLVPGCNAHPPPPIGGTPSFHDHCPRAGGTPSQQKGGISKMGGTHPWNTLDPTPPESRLCASSPGLSHFQPSPRHAQGSRETAAARKKLCPAAHNTNSPLLHSAAATIWPSCSRCLGGRLYRPWRFQLRRNGWKMHPTAKALPPTRGDARPFPCRGQRKTTHH